MKDILRYIESSALIGLIAVWGSETFFWSAPPADFYAASLFEVWIAYSLCVAAVLPAILVTGIRGWKAAFLGGTLLGLLVEGVVEISVYENMPFTIVWTPLAWHGLITGLAVFCISRASVHWPLSRQFAGYASLGLFGAFFAQYWPIELGDMPGLLPTLGYVVGTGMLAVAANIRLDHLPVLSPKFSLAWLAAPALALLAWTLNLISRQDPLMLFLPPLILLTICIAHRQGNSRLPLEFGERAPVWRHLVFVVLPLTSALGSCIGWRLTAGASTNVPVAMMTIAASLALFCWLAWDAVRQYVSLR